MLGLATGGVAVVCPPFQSRLSKHYYSSAQQHHHATGTFDMREMGVYAGNAQDICYFLYRRSQPAGCGRCPDSGAKTQFNNALDKQPLLFVLVIITVFMTAFYMFRLSS